MLLVYSVRVLLIVNINILKYSADFFVDLEYRGFVQDYQFDEKFPMTGRWRRGEDGLQETVMDVEPHPEEICCNQTVGTTICLTLSLSYLSVCDVIVFLKLTEEGRHALEKLTQ